MLLTKIHDKLVIMRKTLLRIIEAKYSVSTWILNAISLFSSAILVLAAVQGGKDVDEFAQALPLINVNAWAFLLALSALGVIIGLIIDDRMTIAVASFVQFVLWVFGFFGFLFVGDSGTTIILLIIPFIVFYTYMFLAALLRDNRGL